MYDDRGEGRQGGLIGIGRYDYRKEVNKVD